MPFRSHGPYDSQMQPPASIFPNNYMNKRLLFVSLVLASSACLATAATEQEVVNRSAAIMRGFRNIPESDIPTSVMRNATGPRHHDRR